MLDFRTVRVVCPEYGETVTILQSDRLTLRPWRDDDADMVLDLYSRLEVQRYIGAVPRLMEDRDQALARIAAWRAIDHPVHEVWAVCLTGDDTPVGTLLLKSIPASDSPDTPNDRAVPSGDTEIGWHFHPDRWGNGYAVEAAKTVLAHAFAAGLDRVVAVTNPANHASQRVCTRIGMRHLGRTDAYYNVACELFEAIPGR
jgi:RimJ/RimL family protein N-acetyltransferase